MAFQEARGEAMVRVSDCVVFVAGLEMGGGDDVAAVIVVSNLGILLNLADKELNVHQQFPWNIQQS